MPYDLFPKSDKNKKKKVKMKYKKNKNKNKKGHPLYEIERNAELVQTITEVTEVLPDRGQQFFANAQSGNREKFCDLVIDWYNMLDFQRAGKEGKTVIDSLCENGNLTLLKFVFAALEARGIKDLSPYLNPKEPRFSPLMRACAPGHTSIVETLVKIPGININHSNS